jgi:hypothetical protein
MPATKPISEAQLAANRANAQKSTGPQSAEAKSRVRLNGLRHGLTGQTVFLPNEDRAAYEAMHKGVSKFFKPGNPLEVRIVRQIADEYWRLDRIKAIEANIFALGIEARAGEFRDDDPQGDAALAPAQTYIDHAKELNLLSIYEQRIKRSVANLRKELDQEQAMRRAAEAHAAVRRAEEEEWGKFENGIGFANGVELGPGGYKVAGDDPLLINIFKDYKPRSENKRSPRPDEAPKPGSVPPFSAAPSISAAPEPSSPCA